MNETTIWEQRCPLCEGVFFKEYRLGLLRCESCGLVLSPLVWQSQIEEHMAREWFGDGYVSKKTSVWVEWFEAWNNRRTLSRLTRYIRHGKLLEIGIDSGSFLRYAKKKGFDVMGCDLSVDICRDAEQKLGITMHCGSVQTLPYKATFDVIVMNHVLEHVQRPIEFLRHAFRLLKPGGILHIAVPNINCWLAHLTGWTSYEPYHLTYFNRNTLLKAVSLAGFSTELVYTRDSFSGWFLAVLRSALGINRESCIQTRPAAKTTRQQIRNFKLVEHAYRINMLLAGGILWPVRLIQGRLGYGDELICIVRKPF